ncbi:YggT family protein [Sphingomonas hengshuiensis]|uniref:Integral membrane protein YggT, involved in response to extracytoplasmic stress (Osmotic shock) n=1 Tax=Sphingomonas hengshuiensis TaxID=1609977 RepID=A0A7U5BG25_9SPHN|nr:YggT family protein [Sphingomonas hengshuiensis]AJP74589.1 integral membrane protein YggT, involved in response to extracytoplasmic stress (osmotic shock) [Sphingomonas hengshuiensis]
MIMLLQIVSFLLTIFTFVIVIQAIMSWLLAFNVINLYNDFVRGVWNGLRVVTEPVYRPIRRILPDFGALDISPLIVLLILYILNNIVIPTLIIQIVSAGY